MAVDALVLSQSEPTRFPHSQRVVVCSRSCGTFSRRPPLSLIRDHPPSREVVVKRTLGVCSRGGTVKRMQRSGPLLRPHRCFSLSLPSMVTRAAVSPRTQPHIRRRCCAFHRCSSSPWFLSILSGHSYTRWWVSTRSGAKSRPAKCLPFRPTGSLSLCDRTILGQASPAPARGDGLINYSPNFSRSALI